MGVHWGASDVSAVFWGDLSLFGGRLPGGLFTITDLEGWEDLPDARESWEDRPQGHGVFDAPVWSGPRRVRVAGTCKDRAARDDLLRELKRGMVFPSTPEEGLRDLAITFAGRTLTVRARLVRFKPTTVGGRWGSGVFGWAAEWVAPDPLRYGPEVSATTGLPTSAGGLEFDLFTDGAVDTGWLEYGDAPVTGRVTLTNEGIADTHPIFTVAGPLPSGFSIVHVPTGSRVEAATTILAGSTLVIDSATGTAVLDGVADRSGQLTRREWQPLPAEGEAEWAFSAPTFDPAAGLTVTARPAYW